MIEWQRINEAERFNMLGELRILPIRGIGEVRPGEDLAATLLNAMEQQNLELKPADILVVTQKIISKAEGRLVDPAQIEPSPFAQTLAAQGTKDVQHYEVVLRESRRIVKMDRGMVIAETHHGFVCANAGVDQSNVDGGRMLALLPADPDRSAHALQEQLLAREGINVAVIISDTFGRPWREGQVNVAIGVAGMEPLSNYTGQPDRYGYMMQASVIAVADELASAAELVMGKVDGVPAALIRGYTYASAPGSAQPLLRSPERDLFR